MESNQRRVVHQLLFIWLKNFQRLENLIFSVHTVIPIQINMKHLIGIFPLSDSVQVITFTDESLRDLH